MLWESTNAPGGRRDVGSALRRRAFTMVELAAVACLVMAVVAMLAPGLRKAREGSKLAVCQQRLARIGQASLIYASTDATEMLIPVHPLQFEQDPENPTFIGAYEYGGKSGIGRTGFCGDPDDPLSSRYGTRCGFGPATRPLNKILYGDRFPNYENGSDAQQLRDTTLALDVYECPSDQGYTGAHCPDFRDSHLSSYDHFGTSYNANVLMVGPSAGSCTMDSISPYLRPQSRIPAPARTLAYLENCGRWAWAVRPDWCNFLDGVDPGTPSGTVGGWHGKDWTYNAAFADGHVETIFMNRYYPVSPTWLFGWSRTDYRCVIIRGDNWQMDTLPGVPIATGLRCPRPGRPSYEACVSEGGGAADGGASSTPGRDESAMR